METKRSPIALLMTIAITMKCENAIIMLKTILKTMTMTVNDNSDDDSDDDNDDDNDE